MSCNSFHHEHNEHSYRGDAELAHLGSPDEPLNVVSSQNEADSYFMCPMDGRSRLHGSVRHLLPNRRSATAASLQLGLHPMTSDLSTEKHLWFIKSSQKT